MCFFDLPNVSATTCKISKVNASFPQKGERTGPQKRLPRCASHLPRTTMPASPKKGSGQVPRKGCPGAHHTRPEPAPLSKVNQD